MNLPLLARPPYIDRAVLEYITIYIDKDLLENIDIDIEKEISENIYIDKILNRLEFGISNRAMIHSNCVICKFQLFMIFLSLVNTRINSDI